MRYGNVKNQVNIVLLMDKLDFLTLLEFQHDSYRVFFMRD